jgi:methyltransferase (TIGR00027 family)
LLAGTPSRTAQGAALHRAAHQLVDRPPVFEDPLALAIVGPEAERAIRAGSEPRAGPAAATLRAFVAVRSRYAEDAFAQAHGRGVRQYVVLGAGLDTFAYRCRRDGVRVFEVDHPATQAWKRDRLAQAGIPVPPTVAYAPVDFEREAVGDALVRAGFDRDHPAFLAWLGVTPYLAPEAVAVTLASLAAGSAPGSELVFDFAARQGAEPRATAARAAFAARAASVGEPVRSELEPDEVGRMLGGAGFTVVEVIGPEGLTARYLAGRDDGLTLRGGHLARARLQG